MKRTGCNAFRRIKQERTERHECCLPKYHQGAHMSPDGTCWENKSTAEKKLAAAKKPARGGE
jgi:hypothetical protein